MMKHHCTTPLIAFALSLGVATADEEPFKPRPLTPETPGLTLAASAKFDAAAKTFEVVAGDNAVVAVFTDTQPGVGTHSYVLRGDVMHENVGGTGYLETWTAIGATKAFSRTLSDFGLMAKLTGSSTWREFILPMHNNNDAAAVKQIELNVNLPDGGKVWLRNLRLEPMPDYPGGGSMLYLSMGVICISIIALVLVKRNRARRVIAQAEMSRMIAKDA